MFKLCISYNKNDARQMYKHQEPDNKLVLQKKIVIQIIYEITNLNVTEV